MCARQSVVVSRAGPSSLAAKPPCNHNSHRMSASWADSESGGTAAAAAAPAKPAAEPAGLPVAEIVEGAVRFSPPPARSSP